MRQIGNAVPVELGRIVASSVACALREDTARKRMTSGFASVVDRREAYEAAHI